jgi:hypothetical protein
VHEVVTHLTLDTRQSLGEVSPWAFADVALSVTDVLGRGGFDE